MESIAVLALICSIFQVQVTSGFPATTLACPHGAVWDSHLSRCFSCSVCEKYPNTPLCESCTSSPEPSTQQMSTEVCEDGFTWDAVQNKCFSCGVCDTYPDTPFCGQCTGGTSGGTQPPSCPEGTVWDGFLRKCVNCTVCETHPNTPVCRFCPTQGPLRTAAPNGLRLGHDTVLVAVLTTLAIFVAMGLGAAVWVRCGPDRGVCKCCRHGHQGKQVPEVEPGKTAQGYKLTQVEDDSGCSSMSSSNTSIVLLTTDKVTVV
ncbi:Hypp3289 [Branchiostoma lanceolatum]|uniref:Hypp3289 protein n=1 Tax=Branchiostoma lanceolatum TaxID=7740 RepID=A0A8K0A1W0_BRALA|nr:Hypp3289 [Branchiostoma lanceolatum]